MLSARPPHKGEGRLGTSTFSTHLACNAVFTSLLACELRRRRHDDLERKQKMKLCRYGRNGFEKPGVIDAQGQLRDLSGVISNIDQDTISSKGLAKLHT